MQGEGDVEQAAAAQEPVQSPTTRLRSSALWVLAVLAIIFILHWAQDFFIPLVLSILIAYALDPIVTWLAKWHIPRVLGGALVIISIVAGLSSAIYTLRDDMVTAVEQLPAAMEKLTQSVRDERGHGPGTIEKMQKAADELGKAAAEATGADAAREVPRVRIEEPVLDIGSYLLLGSKGALVMLGQIVMVLFLVYFLLVSGDLYKRKLVRTAGHTLSEKKITVQILDDINTQIQRFMLVQVFTSFIVGVVSWGAFRWLGLEQAGVWAIAAGLLNSIPYFGPVIVTGGIALVAFLQFGTITMALAVSGAALLITSLEGFLLTPWLTSRAAHMNAVAVFVGLLFWSWLWGVWGLLLAIPIMMVVKAVCDRVESLQPIGEFLGE